MALRRLGKWLKDAAGPSGGPQALGGIDIVSPLRITGWAYAPDDAAHENFRLLVNDRVFLPLGAIVPRPDVMEAGIAPHPDTGFELRFGDLEPDLFAELDDLASEGWLEIALLHQDSTVVKTRHQPGAEYAVQLSSPAPGQIDGWVTTPSPPEPVSVSIHADGWLVERQRLVRADPARAEEEGAGWGCRFETRLVCSVTGENSAQIRLRLAGRIGQPRTELALEVPRWATAAGPLGSALTALRGAQPPVTIVLAGTQDRAALAAQLDALARHTSRPAQLVLLTGTGTAGETPGAHWRGKIEIVAASGEDETLASQLNRAVAVSGAGDVVLLAEGVLPGPRWLENLQLAARTSFDTGLASALTGPFSWPEGWDTEDLARLGLQASGLIWPEARTASPACLYIRRACLDEAGPFGGADPVAGLVRQAAITGWRHVVDDRTVMAGAQAPGTPEPGLLLARARLGHALKSQSPAAPRLLARILFVISVGEGGTAQTNADLMAGLEGQYDTLLLECDSWEMTLKRVRGREHEVLEHHRLSERIEPVSHRSAEYDRIAAGWLTAHAVELVHVRHLSWHGLGLISTARQLSIPVINSFHDFYTACPTVTLMDADNRFCGGRCTPDTGRDCVPDLWVGVTTPKLKDGWVHDWRAGFAHVLAQCDAFVTTSQSARQVILDAFPALAGTRFEVIPHGRDLPDVTRQEPPPLAPDEPLRILLGGHIIPAKGAGLIREIKALDTHNRLEFHILGTCSYPLEPGDAVIHGRYERNSFAERAQAIRPHAGATLSICSETYLHTLNEMWSAGLPVLGIARGAVAERIGTEGPGWLVDPEPQDSLAERLLARFLAIRENGEWITEAGTFEAYARPPEETGIAAMAARYGALYEAVLAQRRVLAGEAMGAAS